MSAKIRPEHLARPALVYIRQSTLVQVLEHPQSTERQYDLAVLAKRLGWDETQVEVIDEDLAHSGERITHRAGFQRLAAEVSLGRVGAILSLEVSRLARSSADWHRLLDLCALSDTLIVDDDGIYDPNDFNDRLVLGMKGTMSEAERHVMRLRLTGGQRHKASKGQLAFPAPTGYVFDAGGTLVFDPDEQVQQAVHLLFERFRLDGSAYAVVRYFRRHGLLFPSRHAHTGAPAQNVWRSLTHVRALSVLKNPLYAGAYVWGRRQQRRVLAEGAVVQRRSALVPCEQWHAFHREAHLGYITWEEHMANRRRLSDNRNDQQRAQAHGAPRRGEALLQGLALCGRCGRRMGTAHRGKNFAVYECRQRPDGDGTCWSVPHHRIDAMLVEVVLDAVAPPELDLSLAVLHEVERQAAAVDRQWQLRIERARYEAARAERQYDAVEPENRIVARTLETRWNQKLQALAAIEREYQETRRARKLVLSEPDKKAILALARDLARVWNAPTTTMAERKRLLRLLIQDVVLTPVDVPQRTTRIQILWQTGATTELVAPRPKAGSKTPDAVIALIRVLAAQRYRDVEIAAELNRRGYKSGRGKRFTRQAITTLRAGYEIPSERPIGGRAPAPERDARGRYSVRGLAVRYDVTCNIVRHWVERGTLQPERDFQGGPFWFTLTPAVEARIDQARQDGYGPRRRRRRRGGGRGPLPLCDETGRYSIRGLVEKYGVTRDIVRYWIKTGVVTPERDHPTAHLRFRITPAAEQRIQAALQRGTGPRRKTHPQHRPHAGDNV